MQLIVIVPAFNEEKTIEKTIQSLLAVGNTLRDDGIYLKIYVVNDGSKDATEEISKGAGAHKIVTHKVNRGLGAAVRSGMAAAFADGADIVVKFDADCQHDANDVARIIRPILNDEADVVYGSRFEQISYRMPIVRRLGNLFFTKFMNWITGWPIRDSQPGIFAVNRSYLSVFSIPGDYNYTQQILLDAYHKGMRFEHVSVAFNERKDGKSFVSLKYPFKVIPQILQVLVAAKPLKTFGMAGLFFMLIGATVFSVELFQWLLGFTEKPVHHVNLVLGNLFFGVQLFFLGLLADLIINQKR